jgi:apolipoprotein N-acyltransferase
MLSIVPPFGLIAFASPGTAAGILFPGTGWLGLAALIAVVAGLSTVPRETIIVGIPVIVLANALYKAPLPPRDWEAVQTNFGKLSEDDAIDQFRAVEAIQSKALASRAKIIVFPEAVIRHWTDATEVFWQPTFDELRHEGKTILVGAIVRRKAQTANVVQIRGAQTGSIEQRVPIPMVMWNPFQQSGFRLRLIHPSSYKLGRYRASLLICYETAVPWPLLTADIDSADVIVAIANTHWARDTCVAAWQYSAVQAWARLFGKATVWSSNTTARMSNRTQRDRSIGLTGP